MRFHLLATPNGQTTTEYSLCGFLALCIRFARMLKEAGHTVFLYASEENEAPCDELITTITKAEQKEILGPVPYQACWFHDRCKDLWASCYGRTVAGIAARKQKGDFILTIDGSARAQVMAHHPDLFTVEYSIGYTGTFAPFRVFESHFHRASVSATYKQNGGFMDEVIPVPFDVSEFPMSVEKENYLLYVGRITEAKGVHLACDVAAKAGVPLKLIGHGTDEEIEKLVHSGAEFLGPLSQSARNAAMSRARALIAPTLYMEPFGCTVVEAQLCGTPVITTPWGGFTETVEQGVSGYRCTMFREFVQAVEDVRDLEPYSIRVRAMSKYSFAAILPQYERYFQRLSDLHSKGFYADPPSKT